MSTENALILIDVQKAFEHPKWGTRNNPQAEEQMRKILESCRQKAWEIIHIQHHSHSIDSLFYEYGEGFKIKSIVAPIEGEKRITKQVNSAFIGTDLHDYLQEKEIQTIVIVGLTTPHCVSTTTRMSGNLGYQTYLISDATAAFTLQVHHGKTLDPELIHDISIATLHDEFATVLNTEDFLQDLAENKI